MPRGVANLERLGTVDSALFPTVTTFDTSFGSRLNKTAPPFEVIESYILRKDREQGQRLSQEVFPISSVQWERNECARGSTSGELVQRFFKLCLEYARDAIAACVVFCASCSGRMPIARVIFRGGDWSATCRVEKSWEEGMILFNETKFVEAKNVRARSEFRSMTNLFHSVISMIMKPR